MAVYLTRKFPDTAEFARHGLFYSFAALGMVFYTLRMETAFFRFGSDKSQRDKAFSTGATLLFVTAIFVSIIIIAFDEPLAALISSAKDTRYLFWIVLIMIFDTIVALPFAKMRLDDRPLKFAFFKVLNTILNILFTLLFLELLPWMQRKGWLELDGFLEISMMIDWTFIANIIASGLVAVILVKEYFKVKFEFDASLLKKMWIYAWPLIIVGIAGVFNQFSDRVFLNNISSPEDSGIYNGAIKIAIIMSLFVSAFNYAAEPFFFNQMKNRDAKEIYSKVAQAFALVASLLFVGIVFYVDLIEYLIGTNYREGLVILPYALLGFLFLGLHYNFSIWYKIKDRTTIGAWIGIGGMVVTILGNILLIPEMGLKGSAISLTGCFGVMALGSYLTGKRLYPIPYDIKRIVGYIVYALFLYFVSLVIRPFVVHNLVMVLGINTILLLAGVAGIWLVDRKNIKALLQF